MVRFTPGHFTLGSRAHSTHWIGGWVGPNAGLNAGSEEKNSHHCPCQELHSVRTAHSLTSI